MKKEIIKKNKMNQIYKYASALLSDVQQLLKSYKVGLTIGLGKSFTFFFVIRLQDVVVYIKLDANDVVINLSFVYIYIIHKKLRIINVIILN